MNFQKKKNKKIISISTGLAVGLIIFFAFLLGINTEINRTKQQYRLTTMEQSMKFKSKLESTVYSSIILTNGYLAYIKSNPNISQEETTKYLSLLFPSTNKLIKNIGVLKDTTIIWVYPLNGNESAIGRNLSDVPEQRDSVLKTKKNLTSDFQGPVNLIQGGNGFISRIPVTLENGTYWGQLSIVIDGEELMNETGLKEKDNNIDVAVFNNDQFPKKPFWGNSSIMNKNPLISDITFNETIWKIAIIPKGGWSTSYYYLYGWLAVTTILSILIGVLISYIVYNRYKLQYQVSFDFLTGVYNRTFLDSYMKSAFVKAKHTNKLTGVLLIDLNNFKSINDIYGHKIGDEVLKITAKRLVSAFNSTSDVIRLGGDEFLIILSDIKNEENLQKEKMNVKALISKEFKYKDVNIDISASVGYSLYRNDGDTLDDIIHAADCKMYEEKRSSLNK